MTKSWRADATEEAQTDLDGLLNIAIDCAQQQLARHDTFRPFAVAVTDAGEVAMIAVDETGEPSAKALVAGAVEALRAQREGLRAAAVVSDVTRGLRRDAIDVCLEHRDGHAMRVQLPYGKRGLGVPRQYGRVRAGGADRRIWADS